MQRRPLTVQGYKKLQEELKRLKSVERIQIIHAIAEARAHGDLSENAEYHAAKEQQSFNEARISEFEEKLGSADVIDIDNIKSDKVVFGAHVKMLDEDSKQTVSYRIIGEMEADAAAGSISITSPIARALIGKSVGDVIEVITPGGTRVFEIISISF